MTIDYASIEARRAELRRRHVLPHRPSSSARGLHHVALLSSDVERTITFYQELLEFPLTEIIENRDYKGSSHFFFDIGNGNLLAFFDFPGLDLGPYQEVLGGLHHIAISVDPATWERLRGKLEMAGVPHQIRAAPPSTSRTPTAPAWSCSPTISVRCTARG
ncbi:VOC family protein [Nonomuraea sp. B5E05]|uniref:VOC family protein n=1 Tax=Nonomuraea sp. B5E05 TaxID=3153569 RepID=UPI0032613AA2